MLYLILTAICITLALILAGFAIKSLFRFSWLIGWLKGSAGLIVLCFAIFLLLLGLDFQSYKPLLKNQSIANLSFNQIQPQQYNVTVTLGDGQEQSYSLSGDLWQLDARVLTWTESLSRMGLMPGYRLDRLSGRYVSLEEEKSMPRTVHALYDAGNGVDIWSLLNDSGNSFGLIKSSYGSATYLPMKDGALYSVQLTHNGLSAIALNDRAKQAIAGWQ